MTDARPAVPPAVLRRPASPARPRSAVGGRPVPAASARPARWRPVRLVGVAATGLALAMFALLHVLVAQISPVGDTISDYALASYGWVFDTAALVLAGGSVPLLGPLLHGRWPAVPMACFGCWCLGLVLLTVFPRDPIGVAVSPTGEVHRWAAVATLLGLPIGALVTAVRHRGFAARAATTLAAACLVALVPFVTAYLAGSPLKPYVGLIERILALGEVGLLLLLGTVSPGSGVAGSAPIPGAGAIRQPFKTGSRRRQPRGPVEARGRRVKIASSRRFAAATRPGIPGRMGRSA